MNVIIPQVPDDIPLLAICIPMFGILCIFYILFRVKIFRAVNRSIQITINSLYIEKAYNKPNIEENFLIKIKDFFDSMTNNLVIYNKKIYTATPIKKNNNNTRKRK